MQPVVTLRHNWEPDRSRRIFDRYSIGKREPHNAPSGTKTGLIKADAKPIRISPREICCRSRGDCYRRESQRQIAGP